MTSRIESEAISTILSSNYSTELKFQAAVHCFRSGFFAVSFCCCFFFCLKNLPNLQLRYGESALMKWSLEEASFLEPSLDEAGHIEEVTDDDGYVTRPSVHDAPVVFRAPPKKQAKSDCNKHTRCTCANFSKQIVGLFDVGKYSK